MFIPILMLKDEKSVISVHERLSLLSSILPWKEFFIDLSFIKEWLTN